MNKKLIKTPEQIARKTKKVLKEYGLTPSETVTITNPFTKKQTEITIERDGTSESKMLLAMTDPNLSRERKDVTMMMYLWERGYENASFLMELYQAKGTMMKETRAFTSQMRFDYEILVREIVSHIHARVERVSSMLGINLEKEIRDYKNWLVLPSNRGKEYTYWDFASGFSEDTLENRLRAIMISEAMFDLEHAITLEKKMNSVTEARQREKGYGIYVDGNGRPYQVGDPDMEEAIERDKKRREELEAQ